MVYRIYVEKQGIHSVQARGMLADLRDNLGISGLTHLRLFNRYDVQGIGREVFEAARATVFTEPPMDLFYESLPVSEGENTRIFAYEYLPGQYDQRADSCAQCIQILSGGVRPVVRSARVVCLIGKISDAELERIKNYLINPVEARCASLEERETLDEAYAPPEEIGTIEGFLDLTAGDAPRFIADYGLAMDRDDLLFCRDYFRQEEKRNPTITELKLIDTYWSDHCRHTTFSTLIDEVYIDSPVVREAFEEYLEVRDCLYHALKKPMTLMDMATIGMKYLKKAGKLSGLDESEEINACSVKIKVKTTAGDEDWLLMFKNETHNHPTEIEPFGGAATCLGGAIRDPLSGRAYVYQAMRVTGAGDVTRPVGETLKGKLPQVKISQGAAAGYSAYGNQIGIATGGVYEIYHEGYVAKRMEIGAVVGAAPAANVIRKKPACGDLVVLLGGRTGRDGCGGATGSSKAHSVSSLETCGAEVQKGNPPEERKLQRLFRNAEAAQMIKRCNDFGAGGVAVAIGELAEGLYIDLSRVPKKYEGLNGTELAISESQERMAVVVSSADLDRFVAFAHAENIEATVVATVTDDKRLMMSFDNRIIVNLSRTFLDSNGAVKHTKVAIPAVDTASLNTGMTAKIDESALRESIYAYLRDLNICSQKGLVERFDSTIGASSVVLPFGGLYQLTPVPYMAAKIPHGPGKTRTASIMAYGFNPYIAEKSPFHGAMYAVVESVTRLVAAGVPYRDVWLTFQEYFERTKNDPLRWGKPAAALLGAFKVQKELEIAAIGGKDSMSGSFEDLDVPPTLVSFAVSHLDAALVVTPELKKRGSRLYLLAPAYRRDGTVDFGELRGLYTYYHRLVSEGKILSAWAVGFGGVFEGVCKMAFGNKIGVSLRDIDKATLFGTRYGAIIAETDEKLDGLYLGDTDGSGAIRLWGESFEIDELVSVWESRLEGVFPIHPSQAPEEEDLRIPPCTERSLSRPLIRLPRPRVLIPVFPGTNCEYDTAAAFEAAGGQTDIFVFRNLTPKFLEESIRALAERIGKSQILMLPGGFSGGDEPDGSGKFITAVFRNPGVREAVTELLEARDGLILGICNGFQALIKLGLLPYGQIRDIRPTDPTLTFNSIGRHQSMMVTTSVVSVKSPWLANHSVGELHRIAVSHGEGRFVADRATMERLIAGGQIVTQYTDLQGNPTMDIRFNPNGSAMAVEGICSPDGRVFGKMGHSERCGEYVAKNIPGEKNQRIFQAGVSYFQ